MRRHAHEERVSAERSITVHVLVLAIALVVPIAGALHAQSAAAPILAVDEGTRLFPIAQLTGSQWVPPPATGLARVPDSWTRWYTAGGSAPIRVRSSMA